ncbi:MAG: hypothetical protein K0R18_388 [Bacillales bacterium]|jgi:hypothetical protein|nr:hypothetical protein [Bacillales bacterium]
MKNQIHPETGLTHSQMMSRRNSLFHELSSPRLSTEERTKMQAEYRKLLSITASTRPA